MRLGQCLVDCSRRGENICLRGGPLAQPPVCRLLGPLGVCRIRNMFFCFVVGFLCVLVLGHLFLLCRLRQLRIQIGFYQSMIWRQGKVRRGGRCWCGVRVGSIL